MRNKAAREIPDHIEGYRTIKPFAGAFAYMKSDAQVPATVRTASIGKDKLLPTIQAALDAVNLQNGATISFHHHLRNGDYVLNMVLDEIARRGVKGVKIAASSLFPVHAPLVEHIRSGVVSGISTTYIAGPLGNAIVRGELAEPVVMFTHGGRARAIEAGDLKIDIAFIAAPISDRCGNINGIQGKNACGPLGYAMVDAKYAAQVVVITDHLVSSPVCPAEITQDSVDFVVEVESIGDANGIVSGTTRASDNPVDMKIALTASKVIEASGLLVDGFSFQTGAGSISLAVAIELKKLMLARGVKGSFASGGITGYIVDMFEAGLFRSLFDVQCFDLRAVESYRRNPEHQAMSASTYANPHCDSPIVNKLDVVILGASEIDLDFNVNVTTGTSGIILGGSGGHADTAAGAQLAIVTTKLSARGFPKIVDRVTTLTTPGETIDVLVTEAGVAVNPARIELAEKLIKAGIQLVPIERLHNLAMHQAGSGFHSAPKGRVVAVVEYRDGTVIDVVRSIV